MSSLFVLQVVVPLAVNVIAGFAIAFCRERRTQWEVGLTATLILFACLWFVHERTPTLVVVPDLLYLSQDHGAVLCDQIGLRYAVQRGGSGQRQNAIQWQSLRAGSLVRRDSTIVVKVCSGPPQPALFP